MAQYYQRNRWFPCHFNYSKYRAQPGEVNSKQIELNQLYQPSPKIRALWKSPLWFPISTSWPFPLAGVTLNIPEISCLSSWRSSMLWLLLFTFWDSGAYHHYVYSPFFQNLLSNYLVKWAYRCPGWFKRYRLPFTAHMWQVGVRFGLIWYFLVVWCAWWCWSLLDWWMASDHGACCGIL